MKWWFWAGLGVLGIWCLQRQNGQPKTVGINPDFIALYKAEQAKNQDSAKSEKSASGEGGIGGFVKSLWPF